MSEATETEMSLPHSLAAEEAVLGGLLIDPSSWARVADVVQVEDFYRPDHRTIFDAIRALATNQKPTDAVTVAEHLERNGQAANVGGLAYLTTLARDTPTAANVCAYAETVRERSLRRRLIQAAADLQAAMYRSDGVRLEDTVQSHHQQVDCITAVCTVDINGGWRQPVNLFAKVSAHAYSSADIPDVLGEFPALFAQRSGTDPSITITAAVCAGAMATHDGFRIEADAQTAWRESARLWVLNVAPPGSGKTPGQKAMLAPLWRINSELRETWEQENRGVEPKERTPLPRALTSDFTPEALSEMLRANPRGIGIVAEEFESLMGGMDRYAAKNGGASRDRGEMLRLFDGGAHAIERVQRGSVLVKNWGA